MTFNSIHGRSFEVSRAKILALSLVAAITLGSGALAQGGGGGAVGGASGAGGAAGGSGAGSAAGASGAHGAAGASGTPGTGNPNSPVSVQPPGSTGQNTINSPGTGAGPGPNPGPPTNKFSSEAGASSSSAARANISARLKRPIAREPRLWRLSCLIGTMPSAGGC
jgi:hypothetical protein